MVGEGRLWRMNLPIDLINHEKTSALYSDVMGEAIGSKLKQRGGPDLIFTRELLFCPLGEELLAEQKRK